MLGLLSRAQRRAFAILVGLIFVMGVMDLAGVAAILPFLAIVSNPSVIESDDRLAWLYEAGGFESANGFLLAFGAGVFLIFMASLVLRAVAFYAVVRFTRGAALSLAERLLRRYLSQPYEWFLSRHSADLGKSILSEVQEVVTKCLQPGMRVLADAVTSVLLIGFLVVIEPVGALTMAVIVGGLFGSVYLRLRRHLERLGRARKAATEERFKVTSEAIQGIKEVKLGGLESAYLSRFYKPSKRLARHEASLQLIGDLPQYLLQAIAFGGMLLFLLYLLIANGSALEAVLPILGAFAFTGLKLMPIVQRLFKDLAAMRFGQAALAELTEALTAPDLAAEEGAPGPRIRLRDELRLSGVTYAYPGADEPTLHGVDLTVPANGSIGIVGPTGAGKTTVIDVVLGLLSPSAGTVSVDGLPITPANRRSWQASIGYVPQSIYLVDDTVAANIAFGVEAGRIDRARAEEAGRLASLDDFVAKLPEGYDTPIGEAGVRLSGGQRQRIGIARALYRDPDLVVLDEATSALDTVTERTVMEAIGTLAGKKTVIVITHRLSTVKGCDKVYVMKDGRVAGEDSYDALARSNEDFRSLLAAAS